MIETRTARVFADRLNFRLHEFLRTLWVSDGARAIWEPRIQDISSAWQRVEVLSIGKGDRQCALLIVEPDRLPALASEAALSGLAVLPLELQGRSMSSYSVSSKEWARGDPFVYRVVIGPVPILKDFASAWAAGSDEEIGRLLGFPACCRRFFDAVWKSGGNMDTTWFMASGGTTSEDHVAEVSGPWETNILWRWLGVRAVSHLPCSFDCEATVAAARDVVGVMKANGLEEQATWMEQILSWPVEWSAYHGIAEIRTPIVKFVTATDSTGSKYVVQRRGSRYPEEGAVGLRFPYRTPSFKKVSDSAAYAAGLQSEQTDIDWKRGETYHLDNGFKSAIEMAKAHLPIVNLVARLAHPESNFVVDLGCGNGALLTAIARAVPGVVGTGLEVDPARADRGVKGVVSGIQLVTGDMFAIYDKIPAAPEGAGRKFMLLMPGRLLEVSQERSRKLREYLSRADATIIVYAYGDWLSRYAGLRGLCDAAGMDVDVSAEGAVGIGTFRSSRSAISNMVDISTTQSDGDPGGLVGATRDHSNVGESCPSE